MRRTQRLVVLCLCVSLLPIATGFDRPEGEDDARRALDGAFHNLYAGDLLAAVEMVVSDGGTEESVRFAYGRKRRGKETLTLVYLAPGDRHSPRALLFQRPGHADRIFVSDGSRGAVRPMAAGRRGWPLFGTEFAYEDFRTHTAEDYDVELLGHDRIDDEPCRVVRLLPHEGPYTSLVVWLSTQRPVIVRTDYFDAYGLWKRYTVRVDRLAQFVDWWVPMQDAMRDVRSGRVTERFVRNVLLDTEIPDDMFSTTRLARGRLPTF